ncbi:hypothetical protein D3C87_1352520 [compost metagenome]|jgi:hypothetical protein
MRFLRHLIRDGFCGGPLAALIGVLMALQALIGGFGTGAMAFASPAEMVICSTDSVGDHSQHAVDPHAGHGGTHGSGEPKNAKHAKDCCLTACQVAAAVHVGIPSKAPAPVGRIAIDAATLVAMVEAAVAPRRLGLSGDARGPPIFPV